MPVPRMSMQRARNPWAFNSHQGMNASLVTIARLEPRVVVAIPHACHTPIWPTAPMRASRSAKKRNCCAKGRPYSFAAAGPRMRQWFAPRIDTSRAKLHAQAAEDGDLMVFKHYASSESMIGNPCACNLNSLFKGLCPWSSLLSPTRKSVDPADKR